MDRKYRRPAEDTFILNSARVNLSEKNIEVLKNIPPMEIDRDILSLKARLHGVTNLMYFSLNRHEMLNLLPGEIQDDFRINYYENALRNDAAGKTLKKAAEIAGEKIVLLKGIDLAFYLYPSTGIRHLSDIDILVDIDKAGEILGKLLRKGFKYMPYKSKVHRRLFDDHIHLPQVHDGVSKIEVHKTFFRDELFHVAQKAFNESVHISENIYRLNTEMNIIFLCSHIMRTAGKVIYLSMLCDLNELIIKYGEEINWDYINSVIHNNTLGEQVKTALTYSLLMLDTPVPDNFLIEDIIKLGPFGLDDLVRMKKEERIDKAQSMRDELKKLNNPLEKLIYAFREIVPSAGYVNERFNIYSDKFYLSSYLKYWGRLVGRAVRRGAQVIRHGGRKERAK